MKYTLFFLLIAHGLLAQIPTDFIHIDQFGYLPDADKVAVLSNPINGYNTADSYTPGTSFQVINAANGQVAFSGSPISWNSGNTHDQSGDQGWWFDFSSVSTPGEYYILDVQNNLKSYHFEIATSVYIDVLKATAKMFYYNRCNAPKILPYADTNWVDGNNFNNALQDSFCRYYTAPNDASLEKDLSGGWFDAGDYNKYVTFTTTVVHNLLYAYKEATPLFQDNWNIPESGNGIPDLLDELNWELAWLEKMMNSDGSVVQKMGSISYSDNANSPPSANVDQRYYGHTCSSASIALATMFAHAALVYEQIPSLQTYSTTLKNKAISCFDHVLPQLQNATLDLDCDDGTIKAGDADWDQATQYEHALLAATYLWELTGTQSYHDYIIANINDAPFVANNWLGHGTNNLLEALLHYTTLAGADQTTIDEIINSITPHISQDWNNFFGFNELDLYRSYMPEWGYNWGSTKATVDFAMLNMIIKKYNVNSTQNASYEKKAHEMIHYMHGVNPQNMVYLSNMYHLGADLSVNQIYHTWFADNTDYDHATQSLYGPAPGFVTGGPNKNYTYSGNNPPYGQPDQKAYLDFNTGSEPFNSWEITEPAIYYQAAFLRLLANFTEDPCNTSTVVYIDQNATGAANGQTWMDAFLSIEDALSASCIDAIDTIRIAQGSYIPNTTDRSFSYNWKSNLCIEGGYQTGGTNYDPDVYEVVLSGNIGNTTANNDNLYHVLDIQSDIQNLSFRSISISDGYANGIGDDMEGAAILNRGSIILDRVKITSNNALGTATAVVQKNTGTMDVKDNCTIENNVQID